MKQKWLKWAEQIQAIAQAGLEYSRDKYDRDRFTQLRKLSLKIAREYTSVEEPLLEQLFAGESGYQTPKVDVRGAMFVENRILLVREQIDNRWSLPGGWADIHLSAKENVEKEIYEEAGVDAKAVSLIAVHNRCNHVSDVFPYTVYKHFFYCRYLEGDFAENIETSEVGFFEKAKLPELSEGRSCTEQLELCFDFHEKYSDSGIFPQTVFD